MKNKIDEVFPSKMEENKLLYYIEKINQLLSEKHKQGNQVRIPRSIEINELIDKYKEVPYDGLDSEKVIYNLVEDFFQGTSTWGNPLWSYNVGTTPSVNSIALYTAALIDNIYLINDDLAGNCCYLEDIMSNMFKQLTKCDTVKGIFTFGGTGTNLYGIKMGLDKSNLDVINCGAKDDYKVLITEDSHYAHVTCSDWVGIGVNNVVKMKSKGLYTDVEAARKQLADLIKTGAKIATIIINGGTTYNHAIDDIKAFRLMIDELVESFELDYVPHLHVDSVIGWQWLFFNDYDVIKNELKLNSDVLEIVKKQAEKMAEIKYADSCGIDFHKGVGGCPIPTSFFLCNNEQDFKYLSKSMYKGIEMHQIVAELSKNNPSDYTLETSRPAGPALASLSNLLILGKKGYQSLIANLIDCTMTFRRELNKSKYIHVCNEDAMGYCTMARIYSDDVDIKKESIILNKHELNSCDRDLIKNINNITRGFYDWDKKDRISKVGEFEYSYSTGFKKIDDSLSIEAIKFYMVSPHMDTVLAKRMAQTVIDQVDQFMNKSAEDELQLLQNIATSVEKLVGKNEFLIYGGILSDILMDKYNKVSDIDIAFKYENDTQILNVIKSLSDNGFSIVADRDYYIRNTHYVRLLYATKGEMFLDIAFMDNPYEVGVLTIDSVFYSNESRELIDNYNGIQHLKENTISLREDASEENPLYIINRLMCVCAKYDISLKNNKIRDIVNKYSKCEDILERQSNDSIAAFLSRLVKSIVTATDQCKYVQELIDENIIGKIFPTLQTVLKRELLSQNLCNVKSNRAFIIMVYKAAKDNTELEALEECFSFFKYRTWNEKEFCLAHIFPEEKK